MSHLLISRRLLGSVGGLRRPLLPSSSPVSSTMLPSHLEPPSTTSAWHQSRTPQQQSAMAFSTATIIFKKKDLKTKIIELPSNLKIDPRAKSSPFYGATKVVSEKKTLKEKKKERKEALKSATATTSAINTSGMDGDTNITKVSALDDITSEADAGYEEEDYDDNEDEDEDDNEDEERVLYDLSTKPDVPRAIPLPQRLHVPIIDIKTGESIGTFHLSEKTFGNDPVRVDILHRVVVWQRNKKRGKRNAGARTKTIHEVSGSGRKVRNQKGGGVARAGHSRPAHWRGGAKAHGPKGRVQDYTTKLNKKVRKMGVRHALSQKLKEGNLILLSDMTIPTHKTRELDVMLGRLGISCSAEGNKNKKGVGANALFIDDATPSSDDETDAARVYNGLDVNFKVASGNLQKVKMLNQLGCNVYDMLKFRKLVLSLAAVKSLEERLEK